jgi:hypothetical protein
MSANGFLDINTIILPEKLAVTAIEALYSAGRKGAEGVALFAGTRDGTVFKIEKTIVPKQKAGSFEEGLIYVVEGDELYRISLDLFDNKQQLVAQIHSHPSAAYHSETDDMYPIVTVLGGVSIVVPNFAKGGVNLTEWAVYRLLPGSIWTELNIDKKFSLIKIIDDETKEKKERKKFRFWPWR